MRISARNGVYEIKKLQLGYETPSVVYQAATGGGAKIVDKYGTTEVSVSV